MNARSRRMDGPGRNWRVAYWAIAAAILVAPALAMAFTDEVNWGSEDFAAAAALLASGGLALDVILRATPGRLALRVALLAAVGAAILLVWAQLAIGVF